MRTWIFAFRFGSEAAGRPIFVNNPRLDAQFQFGLRHLGGQILCRLSLAGHLFGSDHFPSISQGAAGSVEDEAILPVGRTTTPRGTDGGVAQLQRSLSKK
jgi:hypothetical protein